MFSTGEVFERPERGLTGHGIEPLQIVETGTGAVVIAADDGGAIIADPLDDEVGIGGIAYQIATTDGLVVLTGRFGDDGLECFPIGMEVAEYEVAHWRWIYAFRNRKREISGGAPMRAGMPMVPMPRVT